MIRCDVLADSRPASNTIQIDPKPVIVRERTKRKQVQVVHEEKIKKPCPRVSNTGSGSFDITHKLKA